MFRDSVILLVTPHIESYNYSELYGKGIIILYCLVLLFLAAVLYRIYHGLLTAEKGTVEFSHIKDCTGNRLLLLNVP